VPGGDDVDAGHVPRQVHVLPFGPGGVGAGVIQGDDQAAAFGVAQQVDPLLDHPVVPAVVREPHRRRGRGVQGGRPAHEPEEAHPQPVGQGPRQGRPDRPARPQERRQIGVAAWLEVGGDDGGPEAETVPGGPQDPGQARGAAVELVVAQGEAVVAQGVGEPQGQGPPAEGEVVDRAHAPVARIHQQHRVAAGGPHLLHVGGDPGIAAEGGRSGGRMAGPVAVVVEVGGLEQGHPRHAGGRDGGGPEDGQDGGRKRSEHAGHGVLLNGKAGTRRPRSGGGALISLLSSPSSPSIPFIPVAKGAGCFGANGSVASASFPAFFRRG